MRETIRRAARADAFFTTPPSPDGKHPDLMARVVLTVEPLARGAGIRVDALPPRVLPAGAALTDEQRRAIESGVRGTLESGPLQGAALMDLAVAVCEVELFGPGSTPEALAAAAAGRALRQALDAAQPVLMQPVMALDVVVPEANLGVVLGDLQARSALITDTGGRDGDAEVRAQAPLAALLGYTTTLRSLTQGRGQFSMEFQRFDIPVIRD